jgi:carbonic anhydrase
MEENVSRRRFLAGAGGLAAAAALGPGEAAAALASGTGGRAPHPKTPAEAIRLLRAGNRRYRREKLQLRDYSPVGERVASEQKPFAAIITCADSRISPELVFDVERGNIFVSRIAGNSIDDGTLGSTEYAVGVLGVNVVMVLGHTNCGAVKAAIEVVSNGKSYPKSEYGAIGSFVDLVRPMVESLPPDERNLRRCVTANAIGQAQILASRGPIVAEAVAAGKIRVVAGVYNIANGFVSVFRV